MVDFAPPVLLAKICLWLSVVTFMFSLIIIIIIRFLEVGLVLVASVFHDLKLVFQEFVTSGFLDQELVFSLDKMWFRIICQCR